MQPPLAVREKKTAPYLAGVHRDEARIRQHAEAPHVAARVSREAGKSVVGGNPAGRPLVGPHVGPSCRKNPPVPSFGAMGDHLLPEGGSTSCSDAGPSSAGGCPPMAMAVSPVSSLEQLPSIPLPNKAAGKVAVGSDPITPPVVPVTAANLSQQAKVSPLLQPPPRAGLTLQKPSRMSMSTPSMPPSMPPPPNSTQQVPSLLQGSAAAGPVLPAVAAPAATGALSGSGVMSSLPDSLANVTNILGSLRYLYRLESSTGKVAIGNLEVNVDVSLSASLHVSLKGICSSPRRHNQW
jgi:hypothetical protein